MNIKAWLENNPVKKRFTPSDEDEIERLCYSFEWFSLTSFDERVDYWQYILGKKINLRNFAEYCVENYTGNHLSESLFLLDKYIKHKYAHKLNEPEIMAKILGAEE